MIVTLGLSPVESVAVCYRVNAITHGAGATLGLSCQMQREFQNIYRYDPAKTITYLSRERLKSLKTRKVCALWLTSFSPVVPTSRVVYEPVDR